MERKSTSLLTRETLLERLQEDQQHPDWEELLGHYEDFIASILFRMGFRHENKEDALQQVKLKLWQALPKYNRENRDRDGHFRSWLITVVRHAAIDWFRSFKKRHDQVEPLDELPFDLENQDQNEIDHMIETEWKQYIVKLALEELKQIFSPKSYELFVRSLEGHDIDDICKDLGIQKNSAYVMRTRIKKRLDQEIDHIRNKLEGVMQT